MTTMSSFDRIVFGQREPHAGSLNAADDASSAPTSPAGASTRILPDELRVEQEDDLESRRNTVLARILSCRTTSRDGTVQLEGDALANALREVISQPPLSSSLLQLRDGSARELLDVIQAWLDLPGRADGELRRNITYILLRLAHLSGELPPSLTIRGVAIGDREMPWKSGGFADIFLGLHEGRRVVVKRLRINGHADRADLQRKLCREALVWRQLKHPSILPFIGMDADSFKTSICLVSPYLSKGTLFDHVRSPEYNASSQCFRLLLEIAEGLEYLHSQKVVHGDITGANILIDDSSHAQLADFGLTLVGDTTIGRMSTSGKQSHTIRWCSPQRFTDEDARRTVKDDVYAFACVGYLLHTTYPPFHELRNDYAVINSVVSGQRPPRVTAQNSNSVAFKDEMWHLIQISWAQEPDDRPRMDRICARLKDLRRDHEKKRRTKSGSSSGPTPTRRIPSRYFPREHSGSPRDPSYQSPKGLPSPLRAAKSIGDLRRHNASPSSGDANPPPLPSIPSNLSVSIGLARAERPPGSLAASPAGSGHLARTASVADLKLGPQSEASSVQPPRFSVRPLVPRSPQERTFSPIWKSHASPVVGSPARAGGGSFAGSRPLPLPPVPSSPKPPRPTIRTEGPGFDSDHEGPESEYTDDATPTSRPHGDRGAPALLTEHVESRKDALTPPKRDRSAVSPSSPNAVVMPAGVRKTDDNRVSSRAPADDIDEPSVERASPDVSPSVSRSSSRSSLSGFDTDSDGLSRPSTEDMCNNLDVFFPQHDLDQPIIEASSRNTSPVDLPQAPLRSPDRARPQRRSIRGMVERQKRRSDQAAVALDDKYKRRNTKLWDSKLQEVPAAASRSQAAPASPSTPGSRPGFKWIRGESIGKGTYGQVYLALNATTGEMIAVKQVEVPQSASDKQDRRQLSVMEALRSESDTLKELEHPNIVQYLGFEATPRVLTIFLEYVPGGSIGSCIRKFGAFGENVTKSFAAQILDGLAYLHKKGVLHRDMKGDNILVESTGNCKISDFGIAKRTNELQPSTFTGMQGTVFWMAPEAANTKEEGYTSKVDVWGVGCVMLEMWTGQHPWHGHGTMAVMRMLYNAECAPPVPEHVKLSALAEDFRRQCFVLMPEERSSAATLCRHKYLELPSFWSFNGDFKE